MHWIDHLFPNLKRSPTSKMHLVLMYRHVSLILTSVFFLATNHYTSFIFKLSVIVCLYIATLILTNLLRKYIENVIVIKWIIIIETIGLTLLLIPTGGILSPFIWYALNPVLIAASFQSAIVCWGILTIYLSSATFIAFMFFNIKLSTIFEEYSYIYLVSLLTTLLVSLFSGLTKILDEKAKELIQLNEKLTVLNGKYKEALEIVTSLNEDMNNYTAKMVAIEEQNRIANEIHDSVSQRLFGLVYSLHSLQLKSRNISQDELITEFQFLKQTANTTMIELRKAIYSLSLIKKGEQPFLVLVQNYLKEFARLSDIKIDINIKGDETIISSQLKKALYRIILEACGNSVRHGQCKIIRINLVILSNHIELTILDDGIGFNISKLEIKKEKGIGLYNIQSIVKSFGGIFKINEGYEKGTRVYINIPKGDMFMKKVVGS